jgi:hypothetical protein
VLSGKGGASRAMTRLLDLSLPLRKSGVVRLVSARNGRR